MPYAPEVSVIIPTIRRPGLLSRALISVFAQTQRAIEVIVVVDGPDEPTLALLGAIDDPRLIVIANATSQTAAGARNTGARRAAAPWLAFLDDDDEWMTDKLEKQLRHAGGRTDIVLTCLSEIKTPVATYIWPQQPYRNEQPLDEYLFVRRRAFAGASFMQTSAYLIPRAIFLGASFRVDTPHDDWDFILRLSKHARISIETVPEVLVRVHCEEARPSLGKSTSWRDSLDWLDANRDLFTRPGYAGFCLGVVGARAADGRAYRAVVPLLGRALRHGAPTALQLLVFFGFWTVPQPARRKLRALIGRGRAPSAEMDTRPA